MKKKIAMVGAVVAALILAGAGCVKVSQNNATQPASSSNASNTEETYQTYVWKEQGISFKYPKGMFIINNGDNSLYISVSATPPEGEVALFYIKLDVHKNTTLDKVIKDYKDNNNGGLKLQTTEKIGDLNFTKIQYVDGFTSETNTNYLLQVKGDVLDYKVGNKGNAGDAALTLSSLQF